MTLKSIDKTRAHRTEDELRALVEAIHDSPPNAQETNWLEWKSSLALGAAEGRFAVAKAILGFANRSVAEAQLAVEGSAYMVVGVEPGAAHGVDTFDHATFGQRIKTYAYGPRWTPHYVDFSGVTVLVIAIESPRAGDPIHTLQKEFSNDKTSHQAGAIFHRGAAHTEPAGPKEIQMLGERLLHGVQRPNLELKLVSTARPVTRLAVDSEQLKDWLTRHEQYVRDNSGAPPLPPPATQTPFGNLAGLSSLAFLSGQYGTTADSEEFDRRVEEYLGALRDRLVDNLFRDIVRSDENKVYFCAGNMTDDPVSGVQLTVVVPKTGLLVYTDPPHADRLPALPKWPDSLRDGLGPTMHGIEIPQRFDPTAGSVTASDETFEITWDIGNLRPGEWSAALEITVISGPDAPDLVEIEMQSRAMNRRRTATEKTTITVGQNQWSVDDWYVAQPAKEPD